MFSNVESYTVDVESQGGAFWTIGNDFIKFTIIDDQSCGGISSEHQMGEAIINFSTNERVNFSYSISGQAEQHELFEFYHNDELLITAKPTETVICAGNICKMCPIDIAESTSINLEPGVHEFKIITNTIDEKFHSDAYFQINYNIVNENVD
eukprot:UN25283